MVGKGDVVQEHPSHNYHFLEDTNPEECLGIPFHGEFSM